jgi:phosphoribosylformylglycinamidine cyclo-ligase
MTYADAGVDLSSWEETRTRIGTLVKSTYTSNVVGKFGQFGGLFDVSMLKEYEKPILVSSVDGVGTKLQIAGVTGRHEGVGHDIVNHCTNDILVLGAQPLYFLDYLGTGRLSPDATEQIVRGLTDACREAGIALIGGETAEMPGFYRPGEYDLVGTIVGVVDEKQVIDGRDIVPGDSLIGLRSSGLHTNGYSLARKIVTEAAGKSYDQVFEEEGVTFGEVLLRPHRSYLPILDFLRQGEIKGCAHITGGGFVGNVDRILPQGCDALIQAGAWTPDPIFRFLQAQGNVEPVEMYRTFNMSIGMVLVVGPEDYGRILASDSLKQFDPVGIGQIRKGTGKVIMEFA